MNLDNFYFKLPIKSDYILNYCLEAVDNWEGPPIEYLSATYVIPLCLENLLKDKWFKELNDKFPIKVVGLMKIEPFSYYHWHTDLERGVGINMLLPFEGHSHCFFTPSLKRNRINKFYELKYVPGSFYLFNPQKLHCVFNWEQPRYVFSLEFKRNKYDLTYKEVLKWIEKKS
jgi:hypothetical protein